MASLPKPVKPEIVGTAFSQRVKKQRHLPQLPDYAELRCLSNFSFLKGASQPEELVTRAQALGYAALAITDECSLAGV
ncbi:MAG: PHP domain-containing protein, partial [Rhodoferax sp.]